MFHEEGVRRTDKAKKLKGSARTVKLLNLNDTEQAYTVVNRLSEV